MFRVRRSPGEFIADGFASSSNSTSRRERGGAEEEESGRPSVQATSSMRLEQSISSAHRRDDGVDAYTCRVRSMERARRIAEPSGIGRGATLSRADNATSGVHSSADACED